MKSSPLFTAYSADPSLLSNTPSELNDAVNAAATETTTIKNKPLNLGFTFPETNLPIHSIIKVGGAGNDTLWATTLARDTVHEGGPGKGGIQ